ncbi:MAG: ABC transporter ATP-binding protein [Pseudomonadota bacterium]
MNDVLKLQAVRCAFGHRRVLDGVDLTLGAGQRVALLGANGAGKSTLLRAICGRVPVTGRALLDGHRAGTAGARALLGVIPQRLSLFRELTVRENLVAFGGFQGLSSSTASERATGLLAWIGLEDRSGDHVAKLSGGMQRRLSIACGVIHAPRLLLADEPTVGVDAASRRQIERLLADQRAAGTTILEATHDLATIDDRYDAVAILARGRIATFGSTSTLLRRCGDLPHDTRITLASTAPTLASVPGFRLEGNVLRGAIGDVAGELEALLARLRASGTGVQDVQVQPPGIEQIIAHLTHAEDRPWQPS